MTYSELIENIQKKIASGKRLGTVELEILTAWQLDHINNEGGK